jgi:transcriptional regulator with XRE-family HTH domain
MTDSAVELLDALAGDDPAMQRLMEEETINLQVARLVYDAREAAGLTQQQLAKRVGTTQSVISRLEDADYRGHSVTMLQRIAKALDMQLSLRFVPFPRPHPRRKPAVAT